MKVYINKYKDHWISPITIVDYLFFWTDWSKCSRNKWIVDEKDWVDSPEWADKLAEKLSVVSTSIKWVWDLLDHEIRYVKVDRWDTWSMDSTLAHIILPMLKQLRDTKHGSPRVDFEDVPEHMRTIEYEEWDEQQCFDWYKETDTKDMKYDVHDRWDWVLNEMIFAFEHLVDDSWEDEFRSGEHDIVWLPVEGGKYKQMAKGPNDTYKCDYEGLFAVEKRMENGFRLFGKYYRGLWD